MNVFILSTGRCGSKTFMEACKHITNITAAHESRTQHVGDARLDYPDNHIESDNRLSWYLGRLDEKYGDNAVYVHLYRDRDGVANSYAKLTHSPMVRAYRSGIVINCLRQYTNVDVMRDYYDTVNANIRLFLKAKTKTIDFDLASPQKPFEEFWNMIGAQGDFEAAASEWSVHHNKLDDAKKAYKKKPSLARRIVRKCLRMMSRTNI